LSQSSSNIGNSRRNAPPEEHRLNASRSNCFVTIPQPFNIGTSPQSSLVATMATLALVAGICPFCCDTTHSNHHPHRRFRLFCSSLLYILGCNKLRLQYIGCIPGRLHQRLWVFQCNRPKRRFCCSNWLPDSTVLLPYMVRQCQRQEQVQRTRLYSTSPAGSIRFVEDAALLTEDRGGAC
jgi:hypothetical protein